MYQIVNYYREDSQAIVDYKLKSRFLWNDHVSYTRNAIVSVPAKLADASAIYTRLLKNQDDIGEFIKPYYTDTQVSGLVDLLKQHIALAIDVINGAEGSEATWRTNGDDLVRFMSDMNPMFWTVATLGPLWTLHQDLTISQIRARAEMKWDDDIAAYDNNHMNICAMADAFSNGTIYKNMESFCIVI